MSSTVTRPRGPLPARVYWTRRILVLLVAFALVFGLARLLSGGLGDSSDGASARPVGSTLDGAQSPGAGGTPAADVDDTDDDSAEDAKPRKKKPKKKTLAEPEGPCESNDVRVSPVVEVANAGSPVRITLEVTTRKAEACYWEVSPDSVVLKLTSGNDPIWSSQECPAVIPTRDVVPRRKKADTVDVTWNAKRSDSQCSNATDWAMPGWYHAEAVARGSVRPVDHQFELKQPIRRTITPSPTATPEPEKARKDKNKKKDRNRKRGDRLVGAPTEGRR